MVSDKVEEAIQTREWETLEDSELQEAEKHLRERKNNEKGGLNIGMADKWVGISKAMTKRDVEPLGELKYEKEQNSEKSETSGKHRMVKTAEYVRNDSTPKEFMEWLGDQPAGDKNQLIMALMGDDKETIEEAHKEAEF